MERFHEMLDPMSAASDIDLDRSSKRGSGVRSGLGNSSGRDKRIGRVNSRSSRGRDEEEPVYIDWGGTSAYHFAFIFSFKFLFLANDPTCFSVFATNTAEIFRRVPENISLKEDYQIVDWGCVHFEIAAQLRLSR